MYDLIIIGGGPAGVAAGVYASRKQLKTLFITKDWGGQSIVSPEIFNWIGTPSISGEQLAKDLKNHLVSMPENTVEIAEDTATGITTENGTHTVTLGNGEQKTASAILIATGSKRRQLDIPGATEFEHKGLTYCASCDGPLFSGQDVVVVGGGNAGFESAAQLLAYAKSVTLLHRSTDFKADPVTVEKVTANEHMTALTNVTPTEVHGDKFVNGISYKDNETGEVTKLDVAGIFVEIGVVPNTTFLGGTVELDELKRVKIDPWTQRTSTPGIWAAGDCTNIHYHQNNISAGDGVRALEDIYVTLKSK